MSPCFPWQSHKRLDREREQKWQEDLMAAKKDSARQRLDFERQVSGSLLLIVCSCCPSGPFPPSDGLVAQLQCQRTPATTWHLLA